MSGSEAWSTDDLLTRANCWSQAKGYPSFTRASLLAWRQAGLVPPPRFHSLGRGRGSTQLWSAIAYRRVLQISRLRATGVASHRLQRLHLWLLGNPADLRAIRQDLEEFYRAAVHRVHLDLGAESWPRSAIERRPSLQQASQMAGALLRQLPAEAAEMPVTWGGISAPLLTLGQAVHRSPAAVGLLRLWLRHLVVPDRETFRTTMQREVDRLPEGWRSVLPPGLVDVVAAGIGMFVDPDYKSPLLESLTACSDTTLLDLRDAVRAWNDVWVGVTSLAHSLVKQDAAAFLGPLAVASGFLEPLLGSLSQQRPLRTSGDSLTLLAWLLLFQARGVIDSASIGTFARRQGGRRLFLWMATHLEELQAAAGTGPGSLAGIPSILPHEQHGLWHLAYPT